MSEPIPHQDAAEPMDGLRRVIAAIASAQIELEPEDLHAVSRLAPDASGPVREKIAELESVSRFALLEQLERISAEFGGYDFTVVFSAMIADDDLAVRSLAVSGLATCETAGATTTLLAVANSEEEDSDVRREAVTALGEVAMRLELGWASGENAEQVVDALRVIAEDVREDDELRASALVAVGVVTADWMPDLIEEAFQSDAAALHLGAIQAMGRSADLNWLPVLEGSLVAEDDDERLAAVQAIGEIGSEEGAPMLLELFDDQSATEELLQGAVAALGEIGGEEAVEELQQLRTHPDPTVRATAQAALDEATWLDDLDDLGAAQQPFGGQNDFL
ncbi:MAG: HEAT repeat domain-containing protein [Chloroflexota bacterium]|nr:HEAT repeat domain-containing protein [Chloroflexota bacterium]MDE2894548.1 HEAT repeat domain-containing protein [Chloroflexota bacterium]